jgi:predicted DNA-binding transcriptional regulator AlpA
MNNQQNFDATYITSVEVCALLQITRPSLVNAVKRKRVPRPIYIMANGRPIIALWHREEFLPVLDAWKQRLGTRRADGLQ